MSGGHWHYVQHRIQDELQSIASDEEVVKRFPRLAHYLSDLAERLHGVIHDLDWDLSGDTHISNDLEFEQIALGVLREAGTEG